MTAGLRAGLPPLPDRMRRLPLDGRGYPIPFFVDYVDGVPDFRVMDGRKLARAIKEKLCWLCGQPLARIAGRRPESGTFVIGPMCALNRTTAEPPCHRECALFGVQACPFLTRPHAARRTANMPEGWVPASGEMLLRNPGVSLVWVTRSWEWYPVDNGVLCEVGPPSEALWFAEGRTATRDEIERSIETGLPLLLADPPDDPKEREEGLAFIAERLSEVRALMPA